MTAPPEDEDGGDYRVGYRKPPKHTQFQPGRSGNRKGRPKGAKNLMTDLAEELAECIIVREGDQSRRVSKQRAVVMSLVARSLQGDPKVTPLVFSLISELIVQNGARRGSPEPPEPPEDRIAAILDILREQRVPGSSSTKKRGPG